MNESCVQCSKLLCISTLTKDRAYAIGKQGKNMLIVFLAPLFEWLLPYYNLRKHLFNKH